MKEKPIQVDRGDFILALMTQRMMAWELLQQGQMDKTMAQAVFNNVTNQMQMLEEAEHNEMIVKFYRLPNGTISYMLDKKRGIGFNR